MQAQFVGNFPILKRQLKLILFMMLFGRIKLPFHDSSDNKIHTKTQIQKYFENRCQAVCILLFKLSFSAATERLNTHTHTSSGRCYLAEAYTKMSQK